MSSTLYFTRRGTGLMLASALIGLGGCAAIATAPSPALQQQIEAATTRADHEALAVHYDKAAGEARATAAEHHRMANSYGGAYATGRGGASMPAHCNAIARRYEEIAADYDAMAAVHRQTAQQSKP